MGFVYPILEYESPRFFFTSDEPCRRRHREHGPDEVLSQEEDPRDYVRNEHSDEPYDRRNTENAIEFPKSESDSEYDESEYEL